MFRVVPRLTPLLCLLILMLLTARVQANPVDRESLRHGLFDTGRISREGVSTVKQHLLMAYYTGTYGVNEHLDLELGATYGLAAHLRARVALLPRDQPLRITVGSTFAVANSLGDGPLWIPAAHLAVGYTLGKLDLSGQITLAKLLGSETRLHEMHASAEWNAGRNVDLVVNLAQLGLARLTQCVYKPGKPVPCVDLGTLPVVQGGIKVVMGRGRKTTELEILLVYIPIETSDDFPLIVPALSITHRW